MSIIWVPDDYATIQAAVTAAALGDTILVRDGIYHEQVLVPSGKDYIHIIAAGEDVVLDGESMLPVAFDLRNIGTELKGLNIKNYSVGINMSGFFEGAFHRIVENCISNIDTDGIFIANSGNLIWKNKISNAERFGVNLLGNNNQLIGNLLCDNVGGSIASFIDVSIGFSNNVAIIDNLVVKSGAALGIGSFNNLLLYRNKILQNCIGVVPIPFAFGISSSVLLENEVANNKDRGISVDSGTNIISQNYVYDNGRSGILINAPFNIVERNNVFNNCKDGINVQRASNKNLIRKNRLKENKPYDIDLNNPDNTIILNKCKTSDPSGLCRNCHGEAANVILVPDDYPTIQLAVTAAQPGDVILVEDGIYSEEVVIPSGKDNIRIIALCCNAVLDGMNSLETAFTLQGSIGIQIEGFNIKDYTTVGILINGNTPFPARAAFSRIIGNSLNNTGNQGILIDNSLGNLLWKNELRGSVNGIEIIGVPAVPENQSNWLVGNTLHDNTSTGIAIASSSSNGLVDNEIFSNTTGIYTAESSNTLILHNKVFDQSDFGLKLVNSSNSVILNNIIQNNQDEGIHAATSNNVIISGNKIRSNSGTGVKLSDSTFNIIEQNKITENLDNGVNLDTTSTNNLVVFNSICNNQPNDIILENPDNDVVFNKCGNSNPPGLCKQGCES